ncbi:transmembrane protein 106A [Heterocephalus glaber]|uniref:Transmembrane protein 106A n=1 Tax=Heterocephalus glaber TaxID=10181 RepID=A0AAX6S805_HETGA|nr:transmembrane protein 106A [Heterocephalus glaber]XP_021104555.1 transmembrane protein 106A [Heterocephalus glaber]
MGKTLSQPGSPGGAERSAFLSTRPAGSRFVPCPTCRGSREIPRELEEQLVALIPYGDQRLEPRHTKLFVSLAVLVCLATTGFTAFFLFPRSIAVRPVGLSSSSVAFDKGTVHLKATSVLNISNPNYCPVTVTRLTVQALHVSLMVGQLSESLLLHIGPLASDQMLYAVATRISDETTYKICTWLEIKVHYVVLHIQGTLTYSYLGREDQHSFEGSEYVDCRRGSALAPHPP